MNKTELPTRIKIIKPPSSAIERLNKITPTALPFEELIRKRTDSLRRRLIACMNDLEEMRVQLDQTKL